MDNNDNGDFNYVQEKVKPKTKKRIRKAAVLAGGTLIAAVVFGFVARLVFTASEEPVNKLLGITPPPAVTPSTMTSIPRSPVKLVSPTDKPTPSPSPTPTEAPVDTPTGKPTEAVEVITSTPLQTPSPTASATPTSIPDGEAVIPGQIDEPGDDSDKESSPLADYLKMMSELRNVAYEAAKSLVRVNAVTTGINWMDESIETRIERSGIIMADNGVELLVLTDYEPLAGADRIELRFADDTLYEAELLANDADTGLAIVAVALDEIDEVTKETYKYAVLSNAEFSEGEPVIAIGRPNGYFGAVEYGFITHNGTTVYFTDGSGSGFTTDMTGSDESDSVIVRLDGTLIGIAGPSDICVMDLSSFTVLLEKLLNGEAIPYFGIRAENIPSNILSNLELTHGIYVNEAIALSPAAEAGLKKGDIITDLDDKAISSVSEFYEYILSVPEGTPITARIYRSSKSEEPTEEIIVTVSHK